MNGDGVKLDLRNFMKRFKGTNLFSPTANFEQYGISTIHDEGLQKTSSVKLSEEDMQSLKQQIKDSIRDCASRSSVHAFPSLATKGIHPIIVVTWIMCLIASWGYLAYQIYNSIVLFSAFGVSSSISVQFEVRRLF